MKTAAELNEAFAMYLAEMASKPTLQVGAPAHARRYSGHPRGPRPFAHPCV